MNEIANHELELQFQQNKNLYKPKNNHEPL